MSGRRLTLVVLAGLTLGRSTSARAQPTDDVDAEDGAVAPKDPKLAKKLASAAAQLAQKGDYAARRNKLDEAKGYYDQAANAYVKAIETGDDLGLHFDLAIVDEKRGKLDLAVRHLRVVIGAKSGVKPDIQKKATQRHDDLLMQVGLVALEVDPDGTTVSVGGEQLGRSPFTEPLVFMPGVYKLSFQSDGYQPKDLDIKVEEGSEAERKISLEPLQIVVAPPREPGSGDASGSAGVAGRSSKLPLYVGGAVTIAAFGAFIVGGILAVGEHGTFVGAESTRIEREDARARGQNYALFSDIMLGTTLVAAGFTTYWYVFKYRKGNEKPTDVSAARAIAPTMSKVDIVPWVQPSASGLSVAGTF